MSFHCPARQNKPNSCSKCLENKPCVEFRTRSTHLHGHGIVCTKCAFLYSKKRACVDCGNTTTGTRCRPCERVNRRGDRHWNYKTGKTKDSNGYVIIRAWDYPFETREGARIPEHKMVMEMALGRALLSGENVHHKNGVRDDNRLENLELWNTSQPSGQRIEDKVIHALETLKLYRPELLK